MATLGEVIAELSSTAGQQGKEPAVAHVGP